MPVEKLATIPQYKLTEPSRVNILDINKNKYSVSKNPNLCDAYKPVAFLKRAVIIARSAEVVTVDFSTVVAEVTSPATFVSGSDLATRVYEGMIAVRAKRNIAYREKNLQLGDRKRPRRPRRRRCEHNRPKTERCYLCDEKRKKS